MKHKQIYIFIALLMALSLLMAACQPAAAPAVEEPVAEEEMAEEVMEEEMAWEPMMISQECGEGDYIKEFKAVDEMTVEFTLCKSDPAFLTKMAFTPFFIQPAEWIQENGGTGELLEKTVGTGAGFFLIRNHLTNKCYFSFQFFDAYTQGFNGHGFQVRAFFGALRWFQVIRVHVSLPRLS